MGKLRRSFEVGDKAAELGYRLQREHPFWGAFWLWSRDETFPIAVTTKLDVIEDFLDQPESFRDEFEELQRIDWRRMTMGSYQKETTQNLSSLAKQRDETELYEAVGPQKYARYLTWRQTPHSTFTDETGRLRSVLEDARGEALPSSPTESNELREILGTAGYEIWINLRSPRKGETQSAEPQPPPLTGKPEASPRIVTPVTLANLVRIGQEQSLNRRAEWHIRDGQTFIEQQWNTGVVSVEVRADREYALVPTLIHHHRAGQPIDPHWRCNFFVRVEGRWERQQIVLDVFVEDLNRLPKAVDS